MNNHCQTCGWYFDELFEGPECPGCKEITMANKRKHARPIKKAGPTTVPFLKKTKKPLFTPLMDGSKKPK